MNKTKSYWSHDKSEKILKEIMERTGLSKSKIINKSIEELDKIQKKNAGKFLMEGLS